MAAAPRRRRNRVQPFAGMPSVPLPASPPSRLAPALRRLALALLCALAWALGTAGAARADGVTVRSAELRIEEGEVLLNADFDLSLSATLEEALQRGIPLYFLLEFELSRSRWYWLDEKVSQTTISYRVSYNALTRQYRVAVGSGLLAPTFNTLEEVERYVGRVTSRPVASASAVTKGTRYDAALRLRLDVNQLPKPFQVSAIASREWTLSSDWYRWSFVP